MHAHGQVDSIVDRAYAFLLWLLTRTEAAEAAEGRAKDGMGLERGAGAAGATPAVAVATHSVFLLALTSGTWPNICIYLKRKLLCPFGCTDCALDIV